MSNPSQTVQVVMLEPLMERCRDYLRTQGWDLVRAPFLDDEDEVPGNAVIHTYIATIPPGSPLERLLMDMRDVKDQ